jgi:hypothetical protein
MFRRIGLCLVVLGALVVVPGASAAFPGPYAVQGGQGIASIDGSLRFVAFGKGASTVVRAMNAESSTVMSRTLKGAFGVATLSPNGPGEGMFRDGSRFVIQTTGLHPLTQFVVLRTKDLSTAASIKLRGVFAFDALSPNGNMLYLIQHKTVQDVNHYIVRAYDLQARRLLPGRVADKTQQTWIMQGWAVSRATSASGQWVYTLYANQGGTPFIHALDTVHGVAHCIGIPWPATDPDQGDLYQARLTLNVAGTKLAVRLQGGSVYRFIDTTDWSVSKTA